MNTVGNFTKAKFEEDTSTIREVFRAYDSDKDGFINSEEFTNLLTDVFKSSSSPFTISPPLVEALLKIFDEDQDRKINKDEFSRLWKYWLKQILKPVTALVIVDVQNDFISGSLALKGCPAGMDGEDVIKPINSMLTEVPFDVVVYSLDWHPENHISFYENRSLRPFQKESEESEDVNVFDKVLFTGPPKTEQVLWPRHCVQESHGAKLHPQLKVVDNGYTVYKGTQPELDSYSAFWDNQKSSQTELCDLLVKHHVTDVFVCGLAYDVCVGFTATHSTEHGFRTTLIDDASRGVTEQGIQDMKTSLIKKGVVITDSDKVTDMVNGTNRRLEHGLKSAANFNLARQLHHQYGVNKL